MQVSALKVEDQKLHVEVRRILCAFAALAASIGCDETVPAEALRNSNSASAGLSTDETDRTDFGLNTMEPPYFICHT